MKKMSEVEDATTEHGSETIRDSKLMKKFLKVVPGQYIQLVESLEQEKDTGDQRMLLTQSKGCGIRSTRGSTGGCGPTGAGLIDGGRSNAGGGGSGWNSSGGDGRLRGGDGSNGCYDNWNGGRFSGGRNPFNAGGASLRSGGVSRSIGSGRLNDRDGWRDDDDGSCWNGGGGAGSSASGGGDRSGDGNKGSCFFVFWRHKQQQKAAIFCYRKQGRRLHGLLVFHSLDSKKRSKKKQTEAAGIGVLFLRWGLPATSHSEGCNFWFFFQSILGFLFSLGQTRKQEKRRWAFSLGSTSRKEMEWCSGFSHFMREEKEETRAGAEIATGTKMGRVIKMGQVVVEADRNFRPKIITSPTLLILTPTETRKKICQKLFVTDAINRAITRQNVRTESKKKKKKKKIPRE